MIVSDAYLCCLCAILSIHVALSHRAKPHKNWIFIISPSLHILPTTSSNVIDIIGSEMNFNVQLAGCLAFIAIPFCICSISAFIAGTFCYWMVEKFISEGRESGKKGSFTPKVQFVVKLVSRCLQMCNGAFSKGESTEYWCFRNCCTCFWGDWSDFLMLLSRLKQQDLWD